MDVMEAIRTRKSVRSYKADEVEQEKLEAVLEAARLAPSARNLQEWKYVVVRDSGMRKKLAAAAANQKFVAEAPVVLAACAVETKHVMSCGQLSYPIDVAISIDHLTLAAAELGLGTCWIGAFDEPAVKKLLGIPDSVRIVEIVTLGWPAEPLRPEKKSRKALREMVAYERWA